MYDLKKHYLADEKIILNKISSVLKKGVLEMGEEVEKFEDNFKKYCNAKYCVTVSSGSMALLLSLKSLGLKIGDRKFIDNKDLLTKIALNYLAIQKNDLGFPINDVCRFHLNNGAEIDDIVINANVSDVGFKRSFGIMVNYKYELGKIEQNHQEYVNEKKINLSSKLKKYV